jgi:hypothetical protein
MSTKYFSSITDTPIQHLQEDDLRTQNYAQALSDFIEKADTPLTIGLQGEWGTGKTSMMYMIKTLLEQKDVATSWVNTWEYAMFRSAHQTTPAVLQAMLEKLKESCMQKGTWSLKDEQTARVQRIGRFIGALANQVIESQTGVNIKDAASNGEEHTLAIAEIKEQINTVIQDLLADNKNKHTRVVFFVDDLDRIPPSDAVEVLEALKNMFDIPNCIYVLAIDYDVVVKGLESKFGKKTEENEREFRSFFDKIIQVPFSMPTGNYDIKNLLTNKFAAMGIQLEEGQQDLFAQLVKYTVGYNPRSLKRFLNSYNLLRSLKHLNEATQDVESKYDDLVLFALLGLQISYPKIFRMLAQEPDFWLWNNATANKFQINLIEVEKQIQSFGDEMKQKTDEPWEQIIYGFCQKPLNSGLSDPYLSARWEAVIDLLNLLGHTIIGKSFDKVTEKERDTIALEFTNAWQNGLSLAAITNVDDDPKTKNSTEKNKRISFDTLTGKLEQIEKDNQYNQNALVIWRKILDSISIHPHLQLRFNGSNVSAKDNSGNNVLTLWNPSQGIKINVGMYIFHAESNDRPTSNLIEDFSKDPEKRFKVNLTKLEMTEPTLQLIEWAINSYRKEIE